MELLREQFGAVHNSINDQTNASIDQQAAQREEIGNVSGSLGVIIRVAQSKDQKDDAAYDKTYGQQERSLALQKKLAFWAKWAFWAAFGYGLVAFWQVYEMRHQFSFTHRPWVGIDNEVRVTSTQLSITNDAVAITVAIQAKNSGASPALSISMHQDIVLADPRIDPSELIRNTLSYQCDKKWTSNNVDSGTGDFLLPGGTRKWEVPLKQQIVGPVPNPVVMFWVGCFGYADDGDPVGFHGTSFAYRFVPDNGGFVSSIGETPGHLEIYGMTKTY
jgi:hypothetical protein